MLAMDSQLSKIANSAPVVRRAIPADARAISALYRRIYTPVRGGDARDCYPFPQIMNADAVAAMIASAKVVWLVGEAPAGAIVGVAAAMRNIGHTLDRIAEVFGVAVDAAHRHGGLGSALVSGLVDELGDAEFILCEARTDDAGGWKVARNAGFCPVGYEPYAHSMPVGFESMVLTGRWRRRSHLDGPDGEPIPTRQIRRLREAVVGLPSAHITNGSSRFARKRDALPSPTDVNVRRDDLAGRRWFGDPNDMFDRSAGIVGLDPLLGEDHGNGRFVRACYLASSAGAEVGAARVVYDRVDARARILGLRATVPGARMALLQHLVNDLLQLAAGGRLVIIILIASDCPQGHADLVSLRFFPTVYLPAFVAAPTGRGDVVQYTRLAGCSLRGSSDAVTATHWPAAEKVIDQVLSFAP